MPLSIDINTALDEVRSKSIQEVHRDTAAVWVARAIATRRLLKNAATVSLQYKRMLEAEDYEQEALEHAALARDGGETLAEVEMLLAAERAV